MQNIENYIICKIYIEIIDHIAMLLSTIVQATLQLGALQKPARLDHYSMFMAYKNISLIFPGNEIAY